MAAQQRIYRGTLDLGEGPLVEPVDVWASGPGGAAVAFVGSDQVGVIVSGLVLALSTDRRLVVTGLDPEGQPVTWLALDAATTIERWPTATIVWPSGERWTGAEVTRGRHGVRVTAAGHAPAELPAARMQVVGSQRWIVTFDGQRVQASSGRAGCGCGGS